ncbi:Putative Rho GTPase-activating protein [Rhizopus microsporus]|nr:Putative Rho GTPase-activating protein [Rhizopus microsporus]
MTSEELKEAQNVMEEKVYRIWTVLSAFEESAAGCISDMLLHVSEGSYAEGVKMADYFVTHVECYR